MIVFGLIVAVSISFFLICTAMKNCGSDGTSFAMLTIFFALVLATIFYGSFVFA